MKVPVTLLGRSGWSLFNSVWAMVRTYDHAPPEYASTPKDARCRRQNGHAPLKPAGLRRLGEWKGKSSADYRAQRLRFMAEDGSALMESFERDIRTIHGIRSKVNLKEIRYRQQY